MAPPVPAPFLPSAPPDLLRAALEISLTGFILFRPLHDPADPATITDLAYEYVNPAAQRMLQLPERPADSFLTLYPSAVETGIFAFHRDTFLAGGTGRYDVNYQHDGLDNYFQLVDRRCGDFLLMSFTDTAEQPRTAVEVALRESQAAERAARAEAQRQRQELDHLFEQAPVALAVFRGPRHEVELANPAVLRMWGRTPAQALHTPLFELLPEISGQGFEELLADVLATGRSHVAHEMPSRIDRDGRRDTVYWNFAYQPLHGADGQVTGVMVVAAEVTEQVVARRQLQELNQELEARVFERTQALRHAQAEAVAAAQRLLRVTESLPSTSFTTDATEQVLYISPQWYAYTGMVPGADINEAWPGLIHPDDLPAITQEFGAALAEGRPWRYEFRLRGAEGRYRWFASQGVPEPLAEAEEAGRPRQWFGSNFDIDDLKRAQQAQKAQEQLLTTILTSLPADVVTFEGEALRYTFFNDAFQRRMAGRAVLGRTVDELFPEATAQGHPDVLRGVMRTAEPHRAPEAPLYVEDPRTGSRQDMFLDLTFLPLRHGSEPPHGVMAFAVDVTERVQARQRAEGLQSELLAAARRQAQERESFHEIFEQTTALVALLRDPGHRYEYANPAYQQLFPGRPLVGLDVAAAVPEMQEQGFLALLDRVYQTGETHHGTDVPFTVAPAPGQPARTAYYNFTFQAYREAGQVAGISIFAYDVTEQVLARRERDAQRQQLQDLFEQAPVAIGVLRGADYVVEVANPLVAQVWGRTPAEVLGRPVFEALPEARDQGFRKLLDGVRHSGQAFVAEGVPVQLRRGDTVQTVYLNYVYQPLRDADDAITSIAAVGTDVTAQVRDRQRVQELNDQLAASNAGLAAANQQLVRTNADLDTFIYTASHDLKAPITNIEGLLTALGEHLPDAARQAEPVPYLFQLLQGAVERFQLTIDQLTDITRLQQAQQQPAEVVDLAALTEAVRLDLAPLLAAAGARVTVAVADCPTVRFAPKNLRSIVYNLISNAVKYGHPDRPPVAQVRCRPGTPGTVVLEVEDNGLGLTDSQQAKLFGMFQRLHTHVEGSGIGLYMIKKIVDNAGGTIAVASQPGLGTTFTVTLPA